MLARMREEFLDFYEREQPRVERFLMMLGAARQDAEDGAHEAFAEAWRLVTQGAWHQVERPPAWVRTLAYRAVQRPPGRRRSAQDIATAPQDLPGLVAAAPDHAELTVQTLAVLDALRRLGDRQAAAVIALDLEGFPGGEIAAILDIDEQRVRDLRKKARTHLKRNLAAATLTAKEEHTP